MDEKQQDIAWTSMPKEMRTWLRNHYGIILHHSSWQCSAYLRGRLRMMREIYGEHNLTLDAEPEEVLMVERKKVKEIYSFNEAVIKNDPTHSGAWLLKKKLDYLFGDKCLPDKEESNSPKLSNSLQTGKNCLHTTERPELRQKRPRFISLSDEELDNLIFELIRIRDNRRENDRQLTEALAKFRQQSPEP